MAIDVSAVFLILVVGIVADTETSIGTARDSYMDAFKATHSLNKHSAKDRDSSYFPENEGHPRPVFKPQEGYGPPKDDYGPPRDIYGPPKDVYGPPKDVYGPQNSYAPTQNSNQLQQNSYAPPIQSYGTPVYGPPSHVYGPPGEFHGYGLPTSLLYGFLEKFKFKLDLFTIGKIILKVVIFKKIVSFVAILCLLLFIPSLKTHKDKEQEHDDDEDEMRTFRKNSADDRLNNITTFVTHSIDGFTKKYDDEGVHCDSIYCKSDKVLKYINDKITYKKLLGMYVNEKR